MKEKKEGIISLILLGLSPIFAGILLTTVMSLGLEGADLGYFGALLRRVVPAKLFGALYMAVLGPLSLSCLLVSFKAGRYSKRQGLDDRQAWLCAMGPMAVFTLLMVLQLGVLHKYLPYIGPISQCFFLPFLTAPSIIISSVMGFFGGASSLLPVYILAAAMAAGCFYCGRRSREEAQEGLWFIPLGSLIFGFLSRTLTGPDALGEIFSGLYTLSFLAFGYILIMMCFKALKK